MNEATPLRSLLAANTSQEVDTTFNNVQRLIEQQRKRILETDLDYTTRRATLLGQLADLDDEYERRMPQLQEQLVKLQSLR